jgi:hypothetical protein
MYDKQLKIAEFRERAWSARDKAADTRRIATRTAHEPNTRVLELHAAEFEARAAILDREIEALEEEQDRVTTESAPEILHRPRDMTAGHARSWRAKAEEIRTVAESMSSEAAKHTLGRLARDYEAMAETAERGTGKGSSREAG